MNTPNQIARFETREEAEAFAVEHEVIGLPHPSRDGFILVSFLPQGVCAAHENGATGEILEDW